MKQKNVAAIHDIAGFGRCSLTVVLPLLSACGIQSSAIPTALLSTCTGDFKGNTFCDLTNNIEPIAEHWQRENLKFDAIYTGYLCTPVQIYSVISAIDKIRDDQTIIIVDPVMGDKGELYSGFSLSYPSYMLRLCQKANIITPNITEGALLTGLPYKESGYSEDYIESMVKRLYDFTKANIVLTGVSFDKKRIGSAIYCGDEIEYVFADKCNTSFHSTGDIFASVLTGSIMNGRSLKSAAQIASNFVSLCIKRTVKDGGEPRFGVNFETQIPDLIKFLEL